MIKIKLKCFSQVKYALETDELIFELEDGTKFKAINEEQAKKYIAKAKKMAIKKSTVSYTHLTLPTKRIV